MEKPLQEFDWKKSQYERPTHRWVCGRLRDGSDCGLGPSAGGRCSEAEPCQPRRSLMRKRYLLTATCLGVSLAACVGMFGGASPSGMVSPGDVAEHHATIKHDCARCHTAAEPGVNWLSCVGDSDVLQRDMQKCIECHHQHGFTAHGLAVDDLRSLTQKARGDNSTRGDSPLLVNVASRLQDFSPEKNVACTACHHEHRGREFALTRMSNQQCQACHQRQFHSFTQGHPSFQDFPYEQRTRIYFDHARHLGKYFEADEFQRLMPDGQADKSCVSCHEMSSDGVMVLTVGYDKMCRSCHETEIVDEGFPGIPMIALRDLSNAKNGEGEAAEIGEWPGVFADPPVKTIPAFMDRLLKINRARAAGSPPKPIQNDEDYAWQTKRLFQAILHEFAELRLKRDPYFGEAVHASLVPATLQAQRSWFPNLSVELNARVANQGLPAVTAAAEKPEHVMEIKHVRGWYVRESDRTIRYRPTGHADAVVKSLLDSMSRHATAADSAASPLAPEFVDMMMSPTASGSATSPPVASGHCLKCHSLGEANSSESGIHWLGARLSGNKRLTKFSHAPHVRSLHVEGCQSCHQLNDSPLELNRVFQSNYFSKSTDGGWTPNRDFHTNTPLSSGFAAISAAKCGKCHNETGVGQSCLKCHNYHTRSSRTEHVLGGSIGHE